MGRLAMDQLLSRGLANGTQVQLAPVHADTVVMNSKAAELARRYESLGAGRRVLPPPSPSLPPLHSYSYSYSHPHPHTTGMSRRWAAARMPAC